MSSVDERIVEMRFDNKDFEQNVQTTMSTLDKLKSALNLTDAAKSFESIEKAADNVSLDSIAESIESIENRFSTFGIVGMRVLENLTDGAMRAASKIASFVTNSIIGGGIRRATNIEAARFKLMGFLKDEEEVAAVMTDVQKSVDGTAYSLDAAASVASQLATSGLAAGDEMYDALRGIAGVAAVTGSSYEEIGSLYTKIASYGHITARELMSFSTKGFSVTAILAKKMETTEEDIRDMISKGMIDFNTFSEIMMDEFGEHAEKANETLTGVISNVKSALARTGAMFVSPLIEQNGELVQMFNTIRVKINEFNKAIQPIANVFTDAVKSMARTVDYYISELDIGTRIKDKLELLRLWHDFGGFKTFAEGMSYLLEAIVQRVRAIADAFSSVFGKRSKDSLGRVLTATRNFKDFAQSLLLTERQLYGIQSVARVVFSVLKLGINIVKTIIKIVWKPISLIVGILEILEHTILSVVGNVAYGIYLLKEAIRGSSVFQRIVGAIQNVFNKIKEIFSFNFLGKFKVFSKISDWIDGVVKKVEDFFALFKATSIPKISDWIDSFLESVIAWFTALKEAITQSKAWNALLTAGMYVIGGLVFVIEEAVNGVKEFWNAFKETEFAKTILDWTDKVKEFFKTFDFYGTVSSYFNEFIDWVSGLAGTEIKLPEINMGEFAKKVSGYLGAVKEEFDTFIGFIKQKLPSFISFFKKVGEKAKEFFGILTGDSDHKFKDIVQFFKDLGSSLFPKISEAFSNLKEKVKSFIPPEVVERWNNFVTSLKEFKDKLIDKITGKSDEAGFSLGELKDKIVDFIKGIDISPREMVAIGLVVFLSFILIRFATVLKGLSLLIGTVTGLIGKIKDKLIGTFAKNSKILQVAILIGVLASAINTLSKIPADQLKSTVAAFSVMIAVVVAAFLALQLLTGFIAKKFKYKGPKMIEMMGSLLLFVVSVRLVMSALSEATDLVKKDNLIASLLLVVTIMGILIGAAYLLQKVKIGTKTVLGMLAMALLTTSIGNVLIALSNLTKAVDDPSRFSRIVWALVPIMAGLGVLAIAAGQIGIPSAIGLLAVVLIMEKLLPMLANLKDEDIGKMQDFIKKNILLIILLGALGAAMLFIAAKGGKELKAGGKGVLAVAVSLLVLSFAVEKLGSIKPGKLEQGLTSIAILAGIIAVLEFLSVMTLKDTGFSKFATGMLKISAVFVVFAIIIRILSKMDDGAISKGILTIGAFAVMMMFLTLASAATKDAKTGPILAMAATILVLGGLLIALTFIPWDNLWKTAAIVAGLLVVLTVLMGVAFYNLRKLTKRNALGLLFIIGIIATIISLGYVLERMSSIPWQQLIAPAIYMFATLIVMSVVIAQTAKLAKNAKNASGALYLLGIIGIIAALGGALWLISRNPWQSIAAAGAAMTACLWVFSKAIDPITNLASQKKLNKAGIAYLGVMCGVIIALGAALYFVSKNPWQQVIAAGVALALALAAFGVACKLITGLATAKKVNMSSLVYIIAMVVVMGIIAAALYILADKPWESLIAAGAGMALVLAALALCVAALSLIKSDPAQILTAAASVVVMSLALIAIGYAMSYIVGYPTDQIYASAVALGTIIAELAVIIAVLGNVGWAAGAAAAANLIEFVGLLAAGIIALAELWDAIKESLGGTDAVLSKIEALGLIFEAVGAAIGKIITGFLNSIGQGVENMVSHMPAVADYLSTFMSKMSSVYAMAGSQKDDKIDKFDKIIASVTSLGKFTISLADIENFKNAADPFSEAIKAYTDNLKTIEDSDIEKAGYATQIAEKVVELNDKLPSEGGWADKIIGIKNLDTFSSQMKNFGEALVSFCGSISGITNADKLHAGYAKDVADPVVTIASRLGRTGGFIEDFLGAQLDLTTFGLQMVAFGAALKAFAAEIKDFGDYSTQILNIKNAATPMLDISSELERHGGIIDWVIGKKTTLDDFGTQMTSFANSLLSYCETINDKAINLVRMDAVTESISKMSSMVSALDGWDSDNLDTFEDSLEAIGNMSIAGAVNDLWAYKDALIENLDQIFGEAASHIETTNQPDMVAKASGIVDAMCEGIKSTTSITNMTSAISTLMTKSKTGFNSATSDGYNAGRDFIQGFINGLRGTNQYAITAVYSIGRSLFYEFKNALGEKSPSKLTQEAGEFFVQGFINGLGDMEQRAKRKVTSVASGTIEAMSNAVDKAVDYFNDNMDASPVIRPVLDLSSVSYGTGLMQNMFGSYSMRFATATSSSVMASKESETRLNDLSTRLDTAIAKIGEIIQNESENANTDYRFEIPFAIDGREIARASATYTQEELNRITRNMNRKEGYR